MRSLALSTLLLIACSSSSVGTGGPGATTALDADALCNKAITTCGQSGTLADCTKGYNAVRVTAACATAIKNASCDDLAANTTSLFTTCFPTCSTPGSSSCNGDGTITTCSEDTSRQVIVDCNSGCESISMQPYTGTCGKSFGGQTSPDGQVLVQSVTRHM